MSLYLLLYSVVLLWGAAAIPGTTQNTLGDYAFKGTVLTCTIQGFLHYYLQVVAIFYYCSFSVYSYVCVTNRFDATKYGFIEKYLHVGVHVYPLVTAIYFLTIQGYNDTGQGLCGIANDPWGCGRGDPLSADYVPCHRGPGDSSQLFYVAWMIVSVVELLAPTMVMIALYAAVRQQKSQAEPSAASRVPQMNPNTMAKQAAIYLFVVYWVVLPFFCYEAARLSRGPTTIGMAKDLAPLIFWGNVNIALFGLWALGMYWYFSRTKKTTPQPKTPMDELPESIFGSRNELGAVEESSPGALEEDPRFSFNIFDGTNASDAFAEFVYEGDESDIDENQKTNDYWEGEIQDHNK
jgi:hypothetical protein